MHIRSASLISQSFQIELIKTTREATLYLLIRRQSETVVCLKKKKKRTRVHDLFMSSAEWCEFPSLVKGQKQEKTSRSKKRSERKKRENYATSNVLFLYCFPEFDASDVACRFLDSFFWQFLDAWSLCIFKRDWLTSHTGWCLSRIVFCSIWWYHLWVRTVQCVGCNSENSTPSRLLLIWTISQFKCFSLRSHRASDFYTGNKQTPQTFSEAERRAL